MIKNLRKVKFLKNFYGIRPPVPGSTNCIYPPTASRHPITHCYNLLLTVLLTQARPGVLAYATIAYTTINQHTYSHVLSIYYAAI